MTTKNNTTEFKPFDFDLKAECVCGLYRVDHNAPRWKQLQTKVYEIYNRLVSPLPENKDYKYSNAIMEAEKFCETEG